MTIKDYLEQNGLVTEADIDTDNEIHYVEERANCYHIYTQPGFYIIATQCND